jgi:hypothetical protein
VTGKGFALAVASFAAGASLFTIIGVFGVLPALAALFLSASLFCVLAVRPQSLQDGPSRGDGSGPMPIRGCNGNPDPNRTSSSHANHPRGSFMSSPEPLLDRHIHGAITPAHADAAWRFVVPSSEPANDAAQQDEPDADANRNPLWLIAIAGAGLFAAMAALVAFG